MSSVLTALAAASLAVLPVTNSDGDELAQVIDPNQSQGTGQVVRDAGHIDFGPTLNTGEWKVQIHDDTASPSYWRNLEDVSLFVDDDAILTVPDDDAYSFLQVDPGTEVWVIPQNRNNDVVWVGWNTQEPNVLEQMALGTTLSVLGIEGPGDVTAYLQSGNFGEPDVLWSSHEAFPQQAWIEINTHTHANWVFTEPGVYLVEVQFEAQLLEGTDTTASDVLRFAVGDETDPESVFDAVYEGSQEEPSSDDAIADEEEEAAESNLTTIVAVAVIATVAVVLLIAVIVGITARRAAQMRAAFRDATDGESGGTAEGDVR